MSVPRPGAESFTVVVIHTYCSLFFRSSSDHMVGLQFPVPLQSDVAIGLVLVNKL